jgi:streptogramin lyase
MPSDVAVAPNGDIYIADMHHNRVRKVDAKTRHHHRRRQRQMGHR